MGTKMNDRKLHMDHITLGVCYYPEHWPENMWEGDLKRMKECGIEVIRIAEFAWNKFEPQEGVYTFDFFDRFMDLVKKEDMKVILCTPTATPPLWLSEAYPEILNADLDGNRYYHGTRRHNSLNSRVYREFSRKITNKLAEHYVGCENIIGWQLDNEINCENDLYYSESDHEAFREYCRKKYKTLDTFNEKMGTAFWNQTYTDWSQVHLARRTNTYGQTNPHLQLEEKRFISDSVISFFKVQADVIRKWQKRYGRENQFITTNGLFRHIDYQKLVEEVLDFITFDNYPAFAFEKEVKPEQTNGMKDRGVAWNLTRTRSISPVFGIMEQQTGAGGWNCRMMMPMPKPGQMRLWTMQAIAHGADFVSFFRWRTATMGTEIYWHGLHDYDNRENRRVRELKQIHEDAGKMKEIAGMEYLARTAVLLDYENEWDGESDIWHGPVRAKSMDSWFVALQKAHIPFDFFYLEENTTPEDLMKYDTLIYPHATIFTKERKELLKSVAEKGKNVIFGCRSGYKDMQGQCYRMPMPGYIEEICGCQVEEYTYVSEFDEPVQMVCGDRSASAPLFHDVLEVTDGEAMAVFHGKKAGSCHYEGKPAIVRKALGDGYGWYVGSAFEEDTARFLMGMAGISMPEEYKDLLVLPESVEFAVREGEQGKVLFLMNYDKTPVPVEIKKKDGETWCNVLNGKKAAGRLIISGYDVLVLKRI